MTKWNIETSTVNITSHLRTSRVTLLEAREQKTRRSSRIESPARLTRRKPKRPRSRGIKEHPAEKPVLSGGRARQVRALGAALSTWCQKYRAASTVGQARLCLPGPSPPRCSPSLSLARARARSCALLLPHPLAPGPVPPPHRSWGARLRSGGCARV